MTALYKKSLTIRCIVAMVASSYLPPASASTDHGPISSGLGDFNDFASMVAAYRQHGIDFCHAQGYPVCQPQYVAFGDYNGNVPLGEQRASSPPFGPFSGHTQTIIPLTRLCRDQAGTICSDYSPDGWGVFSTPFCSAGSYWETFSDGHSGCVPGRDKYLDQNVCTKNPGKGKPIFPFTGAERMTVDLGSRIGGIPITATFDTRAALPEESGQATWVLRSPASFGPMWESNLAEGYVAEGPNAQSGAANSSISLQLGAHGRETMAASNVTDACGGNGPIGAAGYISDVQPTNRMTFPNSQGRLVDQKSMTESTFATTGQIASKALATGGVLTYTYSTGPDASAPVAGLLETVTDSFGRTVSFTYEQPTQALPPHIKTLSNTDGTVTTFGYDPASGQLINIGWSDQVSQNFVYERSDLTWAMTGVLDEAGKRYASISYDSQGRATTTELAIGVNKYVANYDPDPTIAPHWKVDEQFNESVPVVCRVHHWVTPAIHSLTDPAGQQIDMNSVLVNGMPAFTGQTQPAGSGCGASTSAQGYDLNGNITLYDDFNGNRSCYAFDQSRNVQTIALEGLPKAKACPSNLATYAPSTADITHPERKTTTTWHPDWELKAREAEPKKITTWVYNGQLDPIAGGTAACAPSAPALPDGKPIAVLCARYEQATTDATGALGLSAAVTGATRAWTYTYNQFGQVLTETSPKQSPTDSLSHTTTYTYYTDTSLSGGAGHTIGDLQTVTNPLGQVTSFTSYDAAGRLLASTNANSVVTTQTYWPRGWIKSQTVAPSGAAPQSTSYDYWPSGLLKMVTLPDASTLNYAYDDAHRLTDITDSAGNKMHYVLDNVGNRKSEQVTDASGNLASTVTRVFDALNRVQSQTGLAH